MFRSSSMPSGTVASLSLSFSPEYAISSSAFLSSKVPDCELQASVFHTLDVETGGWDGCRCRVQHHAVEFVVFPASSRLAITVFNSFSPAGCFHRVEHGELWIPRCLILGSVFNPPHELVMARLLTLSVTLVSARNAAVVSAACRLDTTGRAPSLRAKSSGVLGESGGVQ